jgi:hypothetical protein
MIRNYLKAVSLSVFVIPDLIRNPVTLPLYLSRTKNYGLAIWNTKVAGCRLEIYPVLDTGPVSLNLAIGY